jgi:uncharacterized tellurite resistance protein B-like protein
MGLFDKILGGRSSDTTTFSRQEAFAAIMLAVVAADGHISDEEIDGFNAVINRMKIFQEQTAASHNAMMDKLFLLLKKNDSSFLMRKGIESLPAELRETAFTIAGDFVFADGNVEKEEMAILEELRTALGIAENLAVKILEVLEIKNRG